MLFMINLYGTTKHGMVKFDSFSLYAPTKVAALHQVEYDLRKQFTLYHIEHEISIEIIEQ